MLTLTLFFYGSAIYGLLIPPGSSTALKRHSPLLLRSRANFSSFCPYNQTDYTPFIFHAWGSKKDQVGLLHCLSKDSKSLVILPHPNFPTATVRYWATTDDTRTSHVLAQHSCSWSPFVTSKKNEQFEEVAPHTGKSCSKYQRIRAAIEYSPKESYAVLAAKTKETLWTPPRSSLRVGRIA